MRFMTRPTRSYKANRIRLHLLTAGLGTDETNLGEIAMLDGRPRSADAKALIACDLAIVDRRDVLAALEHNPAAWRGLVEVLCSRLRRTNLHLTELALLDLP